MRLKKTVKLKDVIAICQAEIKLWKSNPDPRIYHGAGAIGCVLGQIIDTARKPPRKWKRRADVIIDKGVPHGN